MKFDIEKIASPLGTIVVIARDKVVYSLDFHDYEARMMGLLRKRYGQVELQQNDNASVVSQALERYFAGNITALAGIKILAKGTDFQQSVWAELQKIPAGSTCSYAAIATAIENPKAVRAVGMANAQNPIALIIPCHRVIATNGTLSGYAGGVERKHWLLAHEKAYA